MDTIQTTNLVIDPELCKRLDAAVYSGKAPQAAIDKFNLYHSELIELLSKINPELAKSQADSCL